MANIIVKRTGRIYSFSGVEFIAIMPNGDKVALWSPLWATKTIQENGESYQVDMPYDDPEVDDGARKFAQELWENKTYKTIDENYKKTLNEWFKNNNQVCFIL